MQIGITGGTGFVGRHLARRLVADDHDVTLLSRSGLADSDLGWNEAVDVVRGSVTDADALGEAFSGADAVVHLAGINYERGAQTYERVHVAGTRAVVDAAEAAGVSKILLSSFLRARPDCDSAYHESKWAAEEIVRESAIDHTVFKPGVVYGPGDHLVNHLSRFLRTVPLFAGIGFRERRLRPLAVEDLVAVLTAALTDERFSTATFPVVGPEELSLDEVVRRVGSVIGVSPVIFPLPVSLHYLIARSQQRLMEAPVTSRAQVRMLREGITDPAPANVCDPLPETFRPERPFSREQIQRAVTEARPYGLADFRLMNEALG